MSEYLIPRKVTTRFEFFPGVGLIEALAILLAGGVGYGAYWFGQFVSLPMFIRVVALIVPPAVVYFLLIGEENSIWRGLLRSRAYTQKPQRFLFRVGAAAPAAAAPASRLRLRKRREAAPAPPELPPAVQQWLPIVDAANGLIHRRDGTLVAVLRIEPVNISLTSDAELKRILTALQEALNAMQHPIQIMSVPRPLELDDYVRGLETRLRETDPGRQALLRQYTQYVSRLVAAGEAQERRFYVCLPQPAGNGAAEELLARATDLATRFDQAGLHAHVLDDRELMGLLYVWSHPMQAAFEQPPAGPPSAVTLLQEVS